MKKRKKIWLRTVLVTYMLLAEATCAVVSDFDGFTVFADQWYESVGTSVNALDVYWLDCRDSSDHRHAKASIHDLGGVDGTRINLQLLNLALGNKFTMLPHHTFKTTAPDGGTSPTVTLELEELVVGPWAADWGSPLYLVQVGRDRASPTPEPYVLDARCVDSFGVAGPTTIIPIQTSSTTSLSAAGR